jgi:tetratricopeptide (TPR) repeat protein
LLAGGSRDLPARQQTLRGAIAWSHDLLDERDRALFSDLAVFVGGAGLEVIERVAGEGADAVDGLGSLVEKSLVRQREGVGGEPRFLMLETIREFAIEQATIAGRWPALRAAHAEAYLEFADRVGPMAMSAEKREWLDRLEEEHDNLRAAIGWAVETGDAATALRMTSQLWRFWQMRGYLAEGRERLEHALAMPAGRDHPELRADALDAAAGIAYWQADALGSRAWYAEEIELRRTLGDRAGEAGALYGISFTWAIEGLATPEQATSAREAIDAALAIYTELDDEGGIGRCEWSLANLDYSMNDLDAALEHAAHAQAVFERIGDDFMVGWAVFTLAIGVLAGAPSEGGPPERLDEAREWLRQSLRIFSEAQDVSGYTLVLDALALAAFLDGDLRRAAVLSGAVTTLELTTGTGLNLWNRGVLGFDPAAAFDTPELKAAVAEGEALTVDGAVAYALEG